MSHHHPGTLLALQPFLLLPCSCCMLRSAYLAACLLYQDISRKMFLARAAKHHSHYMTRRTSSHVVGQVNHGRGPEVSPR